MATPSYAVLNHVLNTFRSQIDSGFGTLTGPVQGTLGVLIVISVASMAVMWAVDETHNIWGPLIRKILLVGFWAFIITNWHAFSMALISGMGKLGISAGGGGGGLGAFLDNPSLVFKTGLEDARGLLNYCDYLMGATNKWGHIVAPLDPISWIGFELKQMVAVIEVLIATVIIIFAYGWLALEVVVTVIEFHIVTLVAFCVLPFGVLRQTTSLAENAIAYVFRAGFKAMVLGIIIALGSDVLTKFTVVESPTTLPTLNMLAGLALGVLVILMLALHAPKYASAVISGAPSNGASGLVGAAGGVGAAAGIGARTAIAGVTGGLAGAIGAGRTLYNDLSGGSAGAARAASSLGGSGGGDPSPGAPRAPSAGPSGGGSGGPGTPTAGAPAPGSSSPGSRPSGGGAGAGHSPDAWFATPAGAAGLSATQRASAERSYDAWTSAKPSRAEKYSFEDYVDYAQTRHAERFGDLTEEDEA
jgi:type IV secretion system protein TrbL